MIKMVSGIYSNVVYILDEHVIYINIWKYTLNQYAIVMY